jgi:hypothetical protein
MTGPEDAPIVSPSSSGSSCLGTIRIGDAGRHPMRRDPVLADRTN